jgi:hypothetical protein
METLAWVGRVRYRAISAARRHSFIDSIRITFVILHIHSYVHTTLHPTSTDAIFSSWIYYTLQVHRSTRYHTQTVLLHDARTNKTTQRSNEKPYITNHHRFKTLYSIKHATNNDYNNYNEQEKSNLVFPSPLLRSLEFGHPTSSIPIDTIVPHVSLHWDYSFS